jgi:hypothetical protein
VDTQEHRTVTDPDSIPGLAAQWRRLEAQARTTSNDAAGDAETGRILDQSQPLLARLAEMPATTAAELAIKVLLMFEDEDDRDGSRRGMMGASIKADCERFAAAG